ncbi:oligosaccharide flippase family protein [Jannaschia seohaensis]|uniref:Membrane protein involved in the export of O-antigen and teichoic acid n=1 Tax=Jannaschia seohaensis TaxID=475081 RepID=A0A2Y9B2L7_9RHOB|nr:oligosaccharide flippase family protein [Jannaschia seohaensis]PWJ12898.1 O-antigen/teichoic acid export membrane protein [Jannaschia seohaensis]SSA50706.1 Membrane protein involved in the export of O-antigen and teichoic acid [Jannaschia seohaensis]
MIRAGGLLLGSELSSTVLLFLRNILVARLLSVEDFGIAATFAILWTLIETAGNFSVQKLLVQSPAGDEPRLQDTLHLLQVVRGLVSAAVMLALARPYAAFVQTPELVWAYQVLALVPLLRGFIHLDVFRVQRGMDFWPQAVMNVASPAVSLLAVGAIWLIFPDWRVMLGAIVMQHAAALALSHALARRRFGLAWEWGHVRSSVGFGGPLAINGLLMMAVMQGERMLVANQTDLVTLGWFSAAFLMAVTPARVLPNTISGMFLPGLSRDREAIGRDGGAAFRARALLLGEVSVCAGIWLMLGMAVLGPPLLVGLFGPGYAAGASVLVILGLAQGLRTARTFCTTTALAAGHTWDVTATGVLRAVGVAVALWVLWRGYGVAGLAWTGVAFELAALVLGLILVSRRQGVPVVRLAGALSVCGAALVLAAWELWAAPPSGALREVLDPGHALLAAVLLAAPLAMPRLRGLIAARLLRGGRVG